MQPRMNLSVIWVTRAFDIQSSLRSIMTRGWCPCSSAWGAIATDRASERRAWWSYGHRSRQRAEALRRHSNRGPTEERLEKARLAAEHERRPEPWSPTKTPGPPLWRNMSTDEWRAMVTMYQGGSTANEVATTFEVSESALLARLRAAGVVRPNGKVTLKEVYEMAQLRAQGLSYREIGERYGITRRAVSTRLDADHRRHEPV